MRNCLTLTSNTLEPETLVADWRTVPRGARIIENPLDIMFDCDDVYFPTMWSIHELAHQRGLHDNDVEPAWSGWEPYKCTPEVYWDLWSDFALSGGYTNTPPIEEAVAAMRRLYFAGHRIHIVTARGFMNHASDIRRWTVEHTEEFAIPWHTLTFAQNKVGAMWDLSRGGHMSDERFDYAIDDSPKHITALRDAGVQAYLMHHAHNKLDPSPWRIETVGKFADLILEENA